MGVHCDHTVHFSADLSLWLDSTLFWTLWHQSTSTYSQPSLSNSIWNRSGVWMCKLGVISHERLKIEVKLPLSAANRKSYMPCWLAQQRMTLSGLEWPFHVLVSRAISAAAELLVQVSWHRLIDEIHANKSCLCSLIFLIVLCSSEWLTCPSSAITASPLLAAKAWDTLPYRSELYASSWTWNIRFYISIGACVNVIYLRETTTNAFTHCSTSCQWVWCGLTVAYSLQ